MASSGISCWSRSSSASDWRYACQQKCSLSADVGTGSVPMLGGMGIPDTDDGRCRADESGCRAV